MSSREELRRGLRTLIRSTSEEMAELAEPLPALAQAAAVVRPRLAELRVDRVGGTARASVRLAVGEARLSGTAEGSMRTARTLALAATAAVHALASALPAGVVVTVERVGVREMVGEPAVEVLVTLSDGTSEQVLAGAVFVRRRSLEETAVLAVLNALERRVAVLAQPAEEQTRP